MFDVFLNLVTALAEKSQVILRAAQCITEAEVITVHQNLVLCGSTV